MDITDLNRLNIPNFRLPNIEVPRLDVERIDMPAWHMWADTQFELIKKYVEEFEASLDKDHEVGMMLTNFGQSILMQVNTIGYEDSVMLVFKGTVNGNPATLIQHIIQLNFLLMAVEKAEPEKPKRKIGFIVSDSEG